jgi:hypothetical protein
MTAEEIARLRKDYAIHQHSYVGAFLGLFLGISYLFAQKAKTNLLQAKFAV